MPTPVSGADAQQAALYQQAMALLAPGPVLLYNQEAGSAECCICDPSMVQDIRELASWSYTTWSIPTNVKEAIQAGLPLPQNISFTEKGKSSSGLRLKNQAPFLDQPGNKKYAWDDSHPILVFEVDYLLVDKNVSADDWIKRLQVDSIWVAAQKTGFPYALAIDSGSKSVHFVVRLTDHPDKIKDLRTDKNKMRHLIELADMVFGSVDEGVIKQSGKWKLVRMPCAHRDAGTGNYQRLLGVNRTTTVDELFDWFYKQLRPQAHQDVHARQPLKLTDFNRLWRLDSDDFRRQLLQQYEQGGRGTACYVIGKKIAAAGAKQPIMLGRPHPQMPWGEWDAPFLWWIAAYVLNINTNGWFFSQNDADFHDEKERVREFDDHEARDIAEEIRRGKLNGRSIEGSNLAQAIMESTKAGKQIQSAQEQAESLLSGSNNYPKEEFDPAQYYEKFKELYGGTVCRLAGKGGGGVSSTTWLWFDGKVWVTRDVFFIRKLITDFMGIIDPSFIEKVLYHINVNYSYYKNWESNPDAVVFNNGTLYIDADPQKWRWCPGQFDPVDLAFSCIPHDYDPQAVQCPLWQQFLNRVQPSAEEQHILQEFVGYIFFPGQRFQRWLLIEGSGDNGKGTFTLALNELFGTQNVAAFDFNTVADTHALEPYINKMLVLDNEAESAMSIGRGSKKPVSIVKKWTGGDPLPINPKNKAIFTVVMNAKMILSCNHRPRNVNDSSSGFWKRLLLMKFKEKIAEHEKVRDLHRKFSVSGIIAWGLEGLLRLLARGGFAETKSMLADKDEYREQTDAVLAFKREFFRRIEDPHMQETWFALVPIYKCYQEYVQGTGQHPAALAEFASRLKHYGIELDRPPPETAVVGVDYEVGERHNWCFRGFQCRHPDCTIDFSRPGPPPGSNTINFPLPAPSRPSS